MLRDGTFPIDMAGLNPAGWAQLGTNVNTNTLLSADTQAKLGMPPDSDTYEGTVNLALESLHNAVEDVGGGGVTEEFVRMHEPQWIGVCSTAAATTTKIVGIAGFHRRIGSRITVLFTLGNTANTVNLNINATGNASVVHRGSFAMSGLISAGHVAEFIFDGSAWQLLNPATGVEILFGQSTTAAATAAKTVEIEGFTSDNLVAGMMILVEFINGSDLASPTLSVSGTTAYNIMSNGVVPRIVALRAMQRAYFVFRSSQWQLISPATMGQFAGFPGLVTTTVARPASAIPYEYAYNTIPVTGTVAKSWDLNTYRDVGTFTLYPTTNATTANNWPAGWPTGTTGYAILEVLPFYSNTHVRHRLHKTGTNEVWHRWSTSATAWGAWELPGGGLRTIDWT
jgi:hypothetical protein